ncbi:MAG: AMP-binding protein [Acidimicrobiia bacterium]|nr:AMP-binding protein [Acidimicrobiia bacterium]
MYPGAYAEQHPDQPALVMATSRAQLTFAEFEGNANRLAHLYRDAGLQRGDHVALFMENNLRFFETMSAAERAGLYYTCINSYLTAEEVAYIVDDCDAKVFITTAAKAETAIAAAEETPQVTTFLCVDTDDAIGPFQPYDAALEPFPPTRIDDEQLGAAMLYSSGTTGRPKGILRPLPDAHPGEALPVMQFIVNHLFHMRPGMTYLSPAPIYHSAPQASVASALRLGATSIIMERFEPEQYLALIERHGITHSQVVPTMFSRLLKLPEDVRTRYDMTSLEVVIHAAAPCPVPVKQDMIEWLGPILIEYYGATEANGFTFCDSEEWLAHPGTVGKPILGTLLILDDDGNEVPTGSTGTVWFEGATNFTYYNDEAKTAEGRDDSGQRSTVGDVGYVDDDGYLYLTDRKTYMIISGGVNIYPQETENLLITHDDVMDAAVIGVPNEDLGEEVKAVVQLMPGVEPSPETAQRLIEFCGQHLARFKVPRSVDFEDELPRLPTGKLYKRLLRDRYWGDATSRIV